MKIEQKYCILQFRKVGLNSTALGHVISSIANKSSNQPNSPIQFQFSELGPAQPQLVHAILWLGTNFLVRRGCVGVGWVGGQIKWNQNQLSPNGLEQARAELVNYSIDTQMDKNIYLIFKLSEERLQSYAEQIFSCQEI